MPSPVYSGRSQLTVLPWLTAGTGVLALIAEAALAAPRRGRAGGATYLEKIGSNAGVFGIDFDTRLFGDTVIGLHLGGSSARYGSNLPGGATAFYRFDAGHGRDVLDLTSSMSASSGVALFRTAVFVPADGGRVALPTSPVPEPDASALALVGLAALGLATRRRAAQEFPRRA